MTPQKKYNGLLSSIKSNLIAVSMYWFIFLCLFFSMKNPWDNFQIYASTRMIQKLKVIILNKNLYQPIIVNKNFARYLWSLLIYFRHCTFINQLSILPLHLFPLRIKHARQNLVGNWKFTEIKDRRLSPNIK